MSTPPTPAPGLRERKKALTRRTIQEHALRLFLAQGYQNTTVEEIAAAAGVSHMTFFRHFPTKESVVESDDYDPLIARLIRERPPHESDLTALREALLQGLGEVYAVGREALLARTRLILETPALRARTWDNQYATQRLFAEALQARAPGQSELSRRVIAAAALAAVTTALATWVESDGARELPDLVEEAFGALCPSRA
ncbi:TetR family transcriptional regulator [Streptomyces venezuelae]|uniref:TetR family transcriptional regulator n=1 Tax=Streptomyces venezuelae TaxID=54571 RepID=A0A5P2CZ22_STRVZ|nr:TetR/AcrR family transcriptional regulator [Streptomyces venezuelae]QES47008.1 TetR family transcriptional regulator [Streptomyces venezuelae]